MLAWVEQDGLPLLVWQGPPGIVAAFSGRVGGVSEAPYASLNVCMRTGDDRTRVRENRWRLCQAVGADPARTSSCLQIHSATVHRAAPVPPGGDFLSGTAEPPQADALHTDEPGRAVVALGADCVPVAVCAHGRPAAGRGPRRLEGPARRGAAGGGRRAGPGAVCRAVGPCAGPVLLRGAIGRRRRPARGRRFGDDVVRDGSADLPLCAERALRAAGAADVHVSGLCTICDGSASSPTAG